MRFFLVGLLLFLSWSPGSAQTVGDSVADFGFDYFQRMAGDENTVVSPLSIHAAFSMLTLGASGSTESQARKVLRLQPGFPANYKLLLSSLQPKGEGKFSLASKVWPSRDFRLTEEFTKLCAQSFDATPEVLNFGEAAEARDIINSWVSERTEGLIPQLLPPQSVKSSTELVLSNALYFEASWSNGFRPDSPQGTFYTPTGEVKTPMMSGIVRGLYFQNEEMEAVSLPYEGCPVAMMVIVPKDGLSQGRESLSKELMTEVEMGALRGGSLKMDLSMPKFKVSEASKPLPILKEMGMKQMLGSDPDFSRLAEDAKGLAVDECFHQAVVEVDENGTRAAAATAIATTRGVPKDPPKQVVIDRPFFFVLYQRSTLAPLFIGQVVDPTK